MDQTQTQDFETALQSLAENPAEQVQALQIPVEGSVEVENAPEILNAPEPDFATFLGGEDGIAAFQQQLVEFMLKLSIDNDRLLAIALPQELILSAKDYLENIDLAEMDPQARAIVQGALAGVTLTASDSASEVKLITLREHISLSQAAFLRYWAHSIGLDDYLNKNNIPVAPTTSELTVAFLLATAIPACVPKLENQSRVINPFAP